MDNGDIDFAIIDVLEIFYTMRKRDIKIFSDYARQEFMKLPMTKALLDLNILYKCKFFDFIGAEQIF